ncbi:MULTISPECIES: phosphoribosylamine--glycine ligase [unclassified Virgibacillus]|uniref:phosphoribosylamine--glycine ligase n=1 Tax=unclassified Virgibacillus TaxID=2620237 RepID=UPI0024DEE183|nr:phosphoribosylamine--glycine ligase [Virgibacillus sp. LDC-1]
MKVLVVGRGGREHSIAMKLSKSVQLDKLYVAPGNAGMEKIAECIPIKETNIEGLLTFAKENQIDLTIVGPENPLMAGIANRFQQERLPIFAPTKEAAIVEGSKSFAKAFMMRHAIPTAQYEAFTDAAKAKQFVKEKGVPIVIKADGLAAGKGVVVAETIEAADEAIDDMLVAKAYAEAGNKIVIEEFLEGKEFSLMAFVHHDKVYPMVPARDHKRAFDGDKGPNTGGMGAYAPVQDVDQQMLAYATTAVLQKTVDGLRAENRPFTGILYAGLIQTAEGTKVIEFNTRFGDPETQVVLPLLENDLLQVLTDVLAGNNPHLSWAQETCIGVVLAAEGYPEQYKKDAPVPELLEDGSFIVYAGVKQTKADARLTSDGGRVLLVGAKHANIQEARKNVYRTLALCSDQNSFFYRQDIGQEL